MSTRFAQNGARCGWPQAVLFDLDGTLIDSVPDLAAAVNEVLAAEGREPLPREDVRAMVGHGVRKLVERAFAARRMPLDGEALDRMTGRMMTAYGNRLTADTTLLPGAEALLAAYARVGVKIGVVTNKPEAFAREILDHFGLGPSVDVVVGGDSGPARKPAPDMLRHAMEEIGLGADRAVMVGDSAADIDAARAVPMASIAVRGGYTTVPVDELGADIVIDKLGGVPQAIERLKEPA
ncbi:phosphoglycolate phosphatase [Oricola thermophila]|uniref:Phosphoglycolate phosphatase n=1 Tax=Oricola thermophila TaxID=2742145 RepID=A0A6N1V9E4_9HYPH|nr:phosphoglycolate phosphatase [Oricola thermophila]QKV17621.1 phosphoglycolate phosphatase [Oricola thermophila]